MSRLACGIVGLPNVGKSTLFNALTSSSNAEASNYPFCTIDPNVGDVEVYDKRLPILSEISGSGRIIYARTQFIDIAGLVAGASKGEGLGNKFLANIREADAIIHVVRCFDSDDIIHVSGNVDPIRDIEVINLELILSDLQMIENVIQKLEKQIKVKKELLPSYELLKKIAVHLNENKPVKTFALTDEEKEMLKPYPFLTAKKVLYVANVSEKDLPHMENAYTQKVRDYAKAEGNEVITICARLEEEIAQLPETERQEFLKSLGLEESGLQRLARTSFKMLGLITYLTTGEMETRAWTVHQGASAVEAAGEIHTDIQKGFIRAEVISFDNYVACNGRAGAREKGLMQAEGRDYIVKDGDVILFMHN
jgi:GTP-binding protein YchF